MRLASKIVIIATLFVLINITRAGAQSVWISQDRYSAVVEVVYRTDGRFLASDNKSQLDYLKSQIDKYWDKIIAKDYGIWVESYSNQDGQSVDQDRKSAHTLSNLLKSYMILNMGVKEADFITKNYSGTYDKRQGITTVSIGFRYPFEYTNPLQNIDNAEQEFDIEGNVIERSTEVIDSLWLRQVDTTKIISPKFHSASAVLYSGSSTPTAKPIKNEDTPAKQDSLFRLPSSLSPANGVPNSVPNSTQNGVVQTGEQKAELNTAESSTPVLILRGTASPMAVIPIATKGKPKKIFTKEIAEKMKDSTATRQNKQKPVVEYRQPVAVSSGRPIAQPEATGFIPPPAGAAYAWIAPQGWYKARGTNPLSAAAAPRSLDGFGPKPYGSAAKKPVITVPDLNLSVESSKKAKRGKSAIGKPAKATKANKVRKAGKGVKYTNLALADSAKLSTEGNAKLNAANSEQQASEALKSAEFTRLQDDTTAPAKSAATATATQSSKSLSVIKPSTPDGAAPSVLLAPQGQIQGQGQRHIEGLGQAKSAADGNTDPLKTAYGAAAPSSFSPKSFGNAAAKSAAGAIAGAAGSAITMPDFNGDLTSFGSKKSKRNKGFEQDATKPIKLKQGGKNSGPQVTVGSDGSLHIDATAIGQALSSDAIRENTKVVKVQQSAAKRAEKEILVQQVLDRQRASRQLKGRFALVGFGVNALPAIVGIPSVQLDFYIHNRFSASIDATYSSWDLFGDSYRTRIATVSPEVRVWIGKAKMFTGFYVGVYGSIGQYNLRLNSTNGTQSSFYSAGVSVGYVLPLAKKSNFFIDFGLAGGYVNEKGEDYFTHNKENFIKDSFVRGSFAPTKAKVTFIYRFFNQTKSEN